MWVCLVAVAPAPATAATEQAASQAVPTGAADVRRQVVEVFVREGCPHCAQAEKFLEGLARERPDVSVVIRDVLKDPAALERLKEIAALKDAGSARVPAFFVGGQLIFGFSEEAATDKLIRGALQGQAVKPAAGAAENLSCAAQEDSSCRQEAGERVRTELLRDQDLGR